MKAQCIFLILHIQLAYSSETFDEKHTHYRGRPLQEAILGKKHGSLGLNRLAHSIQDLYATIHDAQLASADQGGLSESVMTPRGQSKVGDSALRVAMIETQSTHKKVTKAKTQLASEESHSARDLLVVRRITDDATYPKLSDCKVEKERYSRYPDHSSMKSAYRWCIQWDLDAKKNIAETAASEAFWAAKKKAEADAIKAKADAIVKADADAAAAIKAKADADAKAIADAAAAIKAKADADAAAARKAKADADAAAAIKAKAVRDAQRAEVSARRRRQFLGNTAFAQGGGGCHAAIAQSGYARGFGSWRPQLDNGVALAHTTSSGGSWMWSTSQAWDVKYGLTGQNGQAWDGQMTDPEDGLKINMFGKSCWNNVVDQNVPRQHWPNYMKECLLGTECFQDPWTFKVTCSKVKLQAVFGSQFVCVGDELTYMEYEGRIGTAFVLGMLPNGAWTNLFENFVWQTYLKPNGLPRDATFSYYEPAYPELPINGPWWVHATNFSNKGVPTPHGWEGAYVPPTTVVRSTGGSDQSVRWSANSVVAAVAASSEAFKTCTLMAMSYAMRVQCNSATAGERHEPVFASFLQKLTKEYTHFTTREGKTQDIASILQMKDSWDEKQNPSGWDTGIGSRTSLFMEGSQIQGDGGGSDNQAFLPLIRQLEYIVPAMTVHSNAFAAAAAAYPIYPVVLMSPFRVGGSDYNTNHFYQAAQYFLPRMPAVQNVPISGTMPPMCPENFAVLANPTYFLEVPEAYFGSLPKKQSYPKETCLEHAFDPRMPPEGCLNFYAMLKSTGVLYFEGVTVLKNKMYGIQGGWTITAMTLASQLGTPVSESWLKAVAPQYKLSPLSSAPSFPMYNDISLQNSLLMLSTYEAFLMQNYMSHLAVVSVCCLGVMRDNPQNKESCAFCKKNVDVCPCQQILSNKHVTGMLFPQLGRRDQWTVMDFHDNSYR